MAFRVNQRVRLTRGWHGMAPCETVVARVNMSSSSALVERRDGGGHNLSAPSPDYTGDSTRFYWVTLDALEPIEEPAPAESPPEPAPEVMTPAGPWAVGDRVRLEWDPIDVTIDRMDEDGDPCSGDTYITVIQSEWLSRRPSRVIRIARGPGHGPSRDRAAAVAALVDAGWSPEDAEAMLRDTER